MHSARVLALACLLPVALSSGPNSGKWDQVSSDWRIPTSLAGSLSNVTEYGWPSDSPSHQQYGSTFGNFRVCRLLAGKKQQYRFQSSSGDGVGFNGFGSHSSWTIVARDTFNTASYACSSLPFILSFDRKSGMIERCEILPKLSPGREGRRQSNPFTMQRLPLNESHTLQFISVKGHYNNYFQLDIIEGGSYLRSFQGNGLVQSHLKMVPDPRDPGGSLIHASTKRDGQCMTRVNLVNGTSSRLCGSFLDECSTSQLVRGRPDGRHFLGRLLSKGDGSHSGESYLAMYSPTTLTLDSVFSLDHHPMFDISKLTRIRRCIPILDTAAVDTFPLLIMKGHCSSFRISFSAGVQLNTAAAGAPTLSSRNVSWVRFEDDNYHHSQAMLTPPTVDSHGNSYFVVGKSVLSIDPVGVTRWRKTARVRNCERRPYDTFRIASLIKASDGEMAVVLIFSTDHSTAAPRHNAAGTRRPGTLARTSLMARPVQTIGKLFLSIREASSQEDPL